MPQSTSPRKRRSVIKRYICLAVLILMAAGGLTGDGLSPQFKNWATSPEAYFLTAEEKAHWKSVKEDAAAREFVASSG